LNCLRDSLRVPQRRRGVTLAEQMATAMPSTSTPGSELRVFYADESARIQNDFAAKGDGRAAILSRTTVVESVLLRLWNQYISPQKDGPAGLALVALGGFGRKWLFPHSDIDLLFLYASERTETEYKDRVRQFSQEVWDLRMKLSPASRKISECERFDPENLEFTISLLDTRYLAGDPALFTQLQEAAIPKLLSRDSKVLSQRLADLTRVRHAKFGETVFHLEPNVKDGPGGLRDYNVASWLNFISSNGRQRPTALESSGGVSSGRQRLDRALNFLLSARCFLHYLHKRDNNTLTWESQDEAAAHKIGVPSAPELLTASDWMRVYFGHARSVHRACMQALHGFPAASSSLHGEFQNLQSRFANPEFSVENGMISLQQPDAVGDPDLLLRAFRFQGRHGLVFSPAAEMQIEQALPSLASDPPCGVEVWHHLQEILLAPHAAETLRTMQSLGFLGLVLPEMQGIDSLVVRDYSHRYTVDEHTFVAIENLHRLRQSQSKWDQRYGELLDELEQPELLYLAILLHDTGKGMKTENHVQASLGLAEKCLERLDVDPPDRETVLFLIGRHLELSLTLRRDIFDPETVKALGEKLETPERLKMLCLLTYADIKAVNPEALTPWKAENIWQLYIGTANYLLRNVDQRLHVDTDEDTLAHLRTLVPAAGRKLESFLEGLPKRYLRTHAVEDVLAHMGMANALAKDSVQVALKRGRHWFDLSLVTNDRPFLFASMTGVLAAWGMNIVKATAFSNHAGVVVDTFYFTDQFRVLELNLPEWERFKQSVHDVITGKADLQRMLRDRLRSQKLAAPKVKVTTAIDFDDDCSAHSTLIEVITQDQPGLLHRISSKFSEHNCSIDIALIETEGQTAIDVFYLTSAGTKLTLDHQSRVRAALVAELGDSHS
jgi:[protein-PII] uridylyltransferase